MRRPARAGERGSVLVIVLWIALGLVALTLYFANSMSFQLRASANRVGRWKGRRPVAGAAVISATSSRTWMCRERC